MRIPLKYSLKSLFRRKGRSAITAFGVFAAVFVAMLMAALSKGLVGSALSTGSPDNVLILSRGAEALEFSAIEPGDYHVIRSTDFAYAPGGEPLASPELYINTFVKIEGAGAADKRGLVRGVLPVAFEVHNQVSLLSGSPPGRGGKIAIGKLAATKLGVSSGSLSVGSEIEFEGQSWTVAGILDAPGTVFESEIWANLDDLVTASKRSDYSAVTIKTAGAERADDLVFDLLTRTDIRVDPKLEIDYYASIANALKPVQIVSGAMTIMLAFCGALVAMNTMFTSILGRTREMAVLLVMGYRRRYVLLSFIFESLILCLIGGGLGVFASLFLNDLPMKTVMGAFRFALDFKLILMGLTLSAVIGVVGASAPAAAVARLSTAEALRSN